MITNRIDRIIEITRGNLVRLYLNNEVVGFTGKDHSPNLASSVLTSVILDAVGNKQPSGMGAMGFDGVFSNVDITDGGSLESDWGNSSQRSFIFDFKIPTPGIWTDTVSRRLFHLRWDGSNTMYFQKRGNANQIRFRLQTQGVNYDLDYEYPSGGDLEYQNGIIRYNTAGGASRDMAINGIEVDQVSEGMNGLFRSGSLDAVIGANRNASNNFFSGYIGFLAIINRQLTDAERILIGGH